MKLFSVRLIGIDEIKNGATKLGAISSPGRNPAAAHHNLSSNFFHSPYPMDPHHFIKPSENLLEQVVGHLSLSSERTTEENGVGFLKKSIVV